jgi:hypothetical protein
MEINTPVGQFSNTQFSASNLVLSYNTTPYLGIRVGSSWNAIIDNPSSDAFNKIQIMSRGTLLTTFSQSLMTISTPLLVLDRVTATSFTGSLQGTSSWAANMAGTSSWAINAVTASNVYTEGNVIIDNVNGQGVLINQLDSSRYAKIFVTQSKGQFGFDGTGHTLLVGAGNTYVDYPCRILFQTQETDRMVIEYDGDVGIGTTAPTDLLHVNGNIRCDRITGNL